MTDDEVRQESGHLVSLLQNWNASQHFEVVLATLPLGREPDLIPFLNWWLDSGRRVALARTGPGRSLGFHEVANLDGPWEIKPFGMREPPASAPLWNPGPKTLTLVPGIAFSSAPGGGAFRLGHGGGYYDRWLKIFGESVFSLGVGFSIQTVDILPVEAHDQTLDGWTDPTGIRGRRPFKTTD